MRRNEAMPSRFINGDSPLIPFEGRKVVIASSAHETVKDQKTDEDVEKFCVYFEGMTQGLILNATNADVLFGMAEDSDDWIGREVVIFKQHDRAFGKAQDVIRLRLVTTPTQVALPAA